MTAIVCNTLTGAVSEYTRHEFHGVTPTHGGSAAGLFAFSGGDDDGIPVVARMRLPSTLRESTLKHSIAMAYVSVQGAGTGTLTVHGAQQSWRYAFPVRPSGQSRCEVGRGIRENYLGFGLEFSADFLLDRLEVLTATSKTRRV